MRALPGRAAGEKAVEIVVAALFFIQFLPHALHQHSYHGGDAVGERGHKGR